MSARARRTNSSDDGLAGSGGTANSCSGADPQRGAARDHELGAGRDGEQPRQVGGGVEQVLEVVEHQQQFAAAEHGGQPFALGRAELLSDLRDHARGVVERGQLDELRTVGEERHRAVGELEREVRLADAARPGQREQPHVRVGEQLGGGRRSSSRPSSGVAGTGSVGASTACTAAAAQGAR